MMAVWFTLSAGTDEALCWFALVAAADIALLERWMRSRDQRSPAWIARQMEGFLGDTLAKYRFLSGDRSYDDLLTAAERTVMPVGLTTLAY